MASSLSLVPRESSRIEDSLKALGTNFSLDPVVVDALIKTGISNFEEFRFFFDSEGAVEPWLSKLSLGDDGKMLQVSRLRRAWHAIALFFRQMEQDRPKESGASFLTGSAINPVFIFIIFFLRGPWSP